MTLRELYENVYLKKEPERLTWELEKTELPPWREPSDPILDAISALVTEAHPQWNGTATELVEALQLDIQPNKLSMRLNVQADQLYSEYHILYESTRNHAGRCIRMTLETSEKC